MKNIYTFNYLKFNSFKTIYYVAHRLVLKVPRATVTCEWTFVENMQVNFIIQQTDKFQYATIWYKLNEGDEQYLNLINN